MLGAACAVYGHAFNPMLSIKALTFFEDGDLALLTEVQKQFLCDQVRATKIADLPEYSVLNGLLL